MRPRNPFQRQNATAFAAPTLLALAGCSTRVPAADSAAGVANRETAAAEQPASLAAAHESPDGAAVTTPTSAQSGLSSLAPDPSAIASESPNLLFNGDFSHGVSPWGAHTLGAPSGAPPQLLRVTGGALCTTLRPGVQAIVGWPDGGSGHSLEILEGRRYVLSAQAASAGAIAPKCVVKLGHRQPPYTGLAVLELSLGELPEAFEVEFVAERADDDAGVAVECRLPEATAGQGQATVELCLHEVALRRL